MELVARKTTVTADQIKATVSLIDQMAIGVQMQYELYHNPDELMKTLMLSKLALVPELPKSTTTEKPINKTPNIPGFIYAAFSNQRVYSAMSIDMHSLPDKMGCLKIEVPVAVPVHDEELIHMFMSFGTIYEFRVVLDQKSGKPNGNYYLTYMNDESAPLAVEGLNGYLIGQGEELIVRQVSARKRLFVGNIPKSKALQDLEKSFHVLTSSLLRVITYPAETEEQNNRGFCFLEYATHGAAVAARRRLSGMKVFGCDLLVDWAEKDREEDGAMVNDNTTIHVRPVRDNVSDDAIITVFGKFGQVEQIKRMRGYVFVGFKDRESATGAICSLNNCELFGNHIKVTWAKPKTESSEMCHIYEKRADRLCDDLLKKLNMGFSYGQSGDELIKGTNESVYALVNNKNVKKRVRTSNNIFVS